MSNFQPIKEICQNIEKLKVICLENSTKKQNSILELMELKFAKGKT